MNADPDSTPPEQTPSKAPFIGLEPMEGESPAAYEAFLAYRRMPGRSLLKLAKAMMLSEGSVKNWSSRFRWSERILTHQAQLTAACIQREAADSVAQAAAQKLFQEKLGQLRDHLLKVGQVVVDNQVLKSPDDISIVDGLRIVNAAVGIAKLPIANPSEQDATAAYNARLEAMANDFEQQLKAGTFSLPPSSPPPAENKPEV